MCVWLLVQKILHSLEILLKDLEYACRYALMDYLAIKILLEEDSALQLALMVISPKKMI